MIDWWCYPTGEEPNLWTYWHANQSSAVQGRHAVVIKFIEAGFWSKPHAKMLTGKHAGLIELCIHKEKNWRIICFRGPKEYQATVLIICHHKDDVYDPRDALDTALDRRKQILSGTPRVHVDVVPGTIIAVPGQGVPGSILGNTSMLGGGISNSSLARKGRKQPKKLR